VRGNQSKKSRERFENGFGKYMEIVVSKEL
jgi:hypothetical protein